MCLISCAFRQLNWYPIDTYKIAMVRVNKIRKNYYKKNICIYKNKALQIKIFIV